MSFQREVTSLPIDPPPSPLEDYVGTYISPGYPDVNIRVNNSTDKLLFNMGRFLEANLVYDKSRQHFLLQMIGYYSYMSERIPLYFEQNKQGQAKALHIPLFNTHDPAKYTKFALSGTNMNAFQYATDNDSSLCQRSNAVPLNIHLGLHCFILCVIMPIISLNKVG